MRISQPNFPVSAKLSKILLLLIVLAAFEVYEATSPLAFFAIALQNYLPFHTLLESVPILVSVMIFVVCWSSRNKEHSGDMLILSVGFLAVGTLDFLHAISYLGMPDLITVNDGNKHLYFWLAARLLAAFTLLAIVIKPWCPIVTSPKQWLTLLCGAALALVFGGFVIGYQSSFPVLFIPGLGLTSLKKKIEFFIIFVNVMTVILLICRMRKQAVYNPMILFAAVCIMAMSEYYFVIYTQMIGAYNLIGHLYKALGYIFLYQAIVVEVSASPYNLLKLADDALQASKKQYDRLVTNIPVGVYLLRTTEKGDFSFDYISPKFCTLLNISEQEIRDDPHSYLNFIDPNDLDDLILTIRMALEGKKNLNWEGRIAVKGKTTWLRMESKAEIQDNGDTLWDGVVIDITERKNDQYAILTQQANYDHLTSLPNRRLFMDRLEQEIKKRERTGQSITLLFIDLDRFKEVNDTQGHESGDFLLIQAADRIKSCVRDYDTVARFGGDEFTVILSDPIGAADTERISQDILDSLVSPFINKGDISFISGSIGIAIYPQDGQNATDLLKSADQAMYAAKEHGKGCFRFYNHSLQDKLKERIQLSNDLRKALKLDQFHLMFQPIVDLSSGSVLKVEALLRWSHPERGVIEPDIFIPIAEDIGVIHKIGDWVLDQAILEIKKVKELLGLDLKVSVNISPLQFNAAPNEYWVNKIKAANLSTQSIIFEITESLLLTDLDKMVRRLSLLRELGIKISIDDFGTGYSSLAYLKSLPLDFLKIDKSFIQSFTEQNQDFVLSEAIILMAHKLGLKVIAEGVETRRQFELLKKTGCDYAQGYLFSKPIDSKDLHVLLSNSELSGGGLRAYS